MDFKFEHLLLFVIAIFLLYHLLGGCGCTNRVVDGFSVGGQSCSCIWKEDGQCKQYQSGKTFNEDTCTASTDQYDCVNKTKYGYDIPICKWDDGIGKLNDKVDTITNRLDILICQLINSSEYDDVTGKLIQGCIDKNRIQNCN